jgi:hypothetical protein
MLNRLKALRRPRKRRLPIRRRTICALRHTGWHVLCGGDSDLRRAQEHVAINCNLPKTLTVVLLRTSMVRRNGKTDSYDGPQRRLS